MQPSKIGHYIAAECEKDLTKHGDNFRGAGYTKSRKETQNQYELMLNVIREENEIISLLDFGCGPGHLLDFKLSKDKYNQVDYAGLDLSDAYLNAFKKRHATSKLFKLDILSESHLLPNFDYIVLNGVFNYRGNVAREEMVIYWKEILNAVFHHADKGIAFNIMSKLVDWERDDLFHMSFDEMAAFVSSSLSRHFVVHHDYGTYEYTTYVYKDPTYSPF